MTPKTGARAPRIAPETYEEILRLDLHGKNQREISGETGTHPRTVKRTLERHYASLAVERNLEAERERAIAMHQEIQRTAWEAVEDMKGGSRSPGGLLDSIEKAQQRIEHLLCLGSASDDPMALLVEFKQIIVSLVLTEAPELAPKLAERLATRAAEAS
jgi:hypothetical protein